ncbi:unnamed protein product [Adineta steineri]|uniref:Tripeptidyl peptidase II second Ig-like domain-containing protein n=2 Tax=Adineta steineri TaxID=433720 RepID=A0A814LHU0_9BILA|nr:unnamed protein product [Adineta steineri]
MKLKASEIQVKCPYLYELFYDSEYKGTLWMCFDTNKQYLGAGDVLNDYSLKLQKERLIKDNGGTGLFLHIEHKVEELPILNFYHSLSGLHTQKKKILASCIKLQWGQQVPIYMTTVPEDKSPKKINTIYQYFTELCSTSSHSVTDTNKKQVNSPVITTEEGTTINSSKEDQLYQEVSKEDLNNYVLLHLARLQQLENQLKQQQQSHLTNDKKDEK